MKEVLSPDDMPEMAFMSFIEKQSDPVATDFDDDGMRTVKAATYSVIGSLSIPPIDEIQLEIWEIKNDNEEFEEPFLTEEMNSELHTGRNKRTNIEDDLVRHSMRFMFRDEIISEIKHSSFGLLASTGEGYDFMLPENVPVFAQRSIEAFLVMKQNGSIVKK